MRVSGTLGDEFKGTLRGQPFSYDILLDSLYIRGRPGNTAYSDYLPIPDKGPHKDRYFILDFDKDRRVVGFTLEGLMEDALLEKAPYERAWIGLKLNFLGAKTMAGPMTQKILEYVRDQLRDQLPTLDSRGRLANGRLLSYA